ncbi:MAG TPA: GGDEF domain-containing phosphodiesterase, partial [Anaerolineaceae bacterium]
VYVSASIGIVRSVDEYERPEDILRDADIAMYQAKALGKSRSEVFDTHLRRKAVLRLQIENELRRALENNEFALYYQPIQALQSSRLVGFEALIRWNHPSRGLLLPAEFMQVAEESGIILPIGRWVLHEACAQTRAWQARYPAEPPITININISGRQFAQPNFVGQVEEVLQETGLNPASLKLEITEGVLIDNPVVAGQAFSRLNDLGVQLQVDDFGTGYSALSYLQRFPIQTIKIDRTFIEEMSSAGKQSGLVQTIIFMARDLGMEATAEGIETEQQLQALQELGCSYGQGFLFSRPMDRTSVDSWFERTVPSAPGAAQPEGLSSPDGEGIDRSFPLSGPPALNPLPGAAD